MEETSDECRRLWLMILDGMSYQQMSQRLGASEGALRVKVLRCRKRAIAVRDRLLSKKEEIVM
jgi:DNA-directed RNA polymerase specialized sigma24 family protein